MIRKLFLWLLIIVGLLGCSSNNSIPDRDIVFQTRAIDLESPYSLGFINADGTNLVYYKFQKPLEGVPIFPAFTTYNNSLLFTQAHAIQAATPGLFTLISRTGKVQTKKFYVMRASPGVNNNQIVLDYYGVLGSYSRESQVSYEITLHLYDLDRQIITQSYLQGDVKDVAISIGANAASGSYVVFARGYALNKFPPEIVILDVDHNTGAVIHQETQTIGELGPMLENPSISPDGQKIAYTTIDGIYVIDVDGKNRRKLVDSCAGCEKYTLEQSSLIKWPSAPSWGADSKWFVYHICDKPLPWSCRELNDYKIAKVNIETGEQVELVRGGINPYWDLSSLSK